MTAGHPPAYGPGQPALTAPPIVLGRRLSARIAALSASAIVPGGLACLVAGSGMVSGTKAWAVGLVLLAFGFWRLSYLVLGRTGFVLGADGTVEWRVGGWGRRIPLNAVLQAHPYGAALDLGWVYGLRIEWVDDDGCRRSTVLPDVFEEPPEELARMILSRTLP